MVREWFNRYLNELEEYFVTLHYEADTIPTFTDNPPERHESGNYPKVDFIPFENAYIRLTAKLRPMVYELGFLKN